MTKKFEGKEVAREFNNTFYSKGDDGFNHLVVPEFEYTPLDSNSDDARFLLLYPTSTAADYVHGNLETHPMTDFTPIYGDIRCERIPKTTRRH